MKLNTPRDVAVFIALAIGGASSLAYVLIAPFLDAFNWIVLASLFIITSLVCYLIVYSALEYFINKRIRLVYRTIRNYKFGAKDQEDFNMKEDVIGNVNKEVINWAQSNQEQIKLLTDQESFRREFIGNLSHELKTPIFSIQGYILTLLEGGLEDETINRKFLERASKGVDRITGIVEDLDTITKMEGNRMDMKVRSEDIVDLAREVIESFEFKANEHGNKVVFDKTYDKPIHVQMDRSAIAQVFTNLINNSINYGSEEGTTEVRFHDMEDRILIEVSDDGVGISEEHLSRLFERFYRVDKSRSRHVGGTGLGLAIVKHIVEAHGEQINVRSTEGTGSTFSFTLKKA